MYFSLPQVFSQALTTSSKKTTEKTMAKLSEKTYTNESKRAEKYL